MLAIKGTQSLGVQARHRTPKTTRIYLYAHLVLKEAALAKLKSYEHRKRHTRPKLNPQARLAAIPCPHRCLSGSPGRQTTALGASDCSALRLSGDTMHANKVHQPTTITPCGRGARPGQRLAVEPCQRNGDRGRCHLGLWLRRRCRPGRQPADERDATRGDARIGTEPISAGSTPQIWRRN